MISLEKRKEKENDYMNSNDDFALNLKQDIMIIMQTGQAGQT